MSAQVASTSSSSPVIRPLVGIGVIVVTSVNHSKHPNCVLVGLRKGSHGEGTLALPDIINLSHVASTNDIFLPPANPIAKHYITLFIQGNLKDDSQEPKLLEPEKCLGWQWMTWNELIRLYETQVANESSAFSSNSPISTFSSLSSPTLFLPLFNLIKSGYKPF